MEDLNLEGKYVVEGIMSSRDTLNEKMPLSRLLIQMDGHIQGISG